MQGWRWVLYVQIAVEVLLVGAVVIARRQGQNSDMLVLPLVINFILMGLTLKLVRKRRSCCS